jgi:hypothetical protein
MIKVWGPLQNTECYTDFMININVHLCIIYLIIF